MTDERSIILILGMILGCIIGVSGTLWLKEDK